MNEDITDMILLDETHEVSIEELAELSGLSIEELDILVENGALIPTKTVFGINTFNTRHIISIRKLSKLKQDFELESSSLSLILVFLDRIRLLEHQLEQR